MYEFKIPKISRIYIYLFLIILLLIPSLFLVHIKLINPFFWWPLSDIFVITNSGDMSRTTSMLSETPAYGLILYILSTVSGLTPIKVAYYPIGALIVPLCYFCLSKKIFESTLMAILITLYIAYDFSIYPGYFSTFSYLWTETLFISFLILYIFIINKKDWRYFILIFIIFVTTYNLHPTYTFWIITLTLAINLSLYLVKIIDPDRKISLTTSTFWVFVVFYFSFNQLIYSQFIRKVISIEPSMISDEFLSTIKSFLGSHPLTEKYTLPTQPPNAIIGYSTFIRTVVIFVFLSVALIFWIKNNYRNISQKFDNDMILLTSLLMVGVIHTVGYALYGHMSLRFIVLMFPIATVLALKKANLRDTVAIIFLISIILLGVLQTGSYIIEHYKDPVNNIDNVKVGSIWLLKEVHGTPGILSDFDTSQILNFYFISENRNISQKFYNSELYNLIVSPEYNQETNKALRTKIDYVVINNANIDETTTSVGWKNFEPLSKYSYGIENNININKIYDSGNIWVSKT